MILSITQNLILKLFSGYFEKYQITSVFNLLDEHRFPTNTNIRPNFEGGIL